mmetsp:Transcript_22861/g.28390  ORF Transcript_22861/g.28390 Transcript_22861/m.28390 type:complete len:332 (-) Transcript_22861:1364-2359(-)
MRSGKDVRSDASHLDEGTTEDERGDCHELDEDVDRGSTGVLHGVAHGVANDGGLVRLGALPLHLAVHDEAASLNVLLGIVPGAAGVRRADRDLDTADNVTCEKTADTAGSQQEAHGEGGGEDEDAGSDHAFNRSLGRNSDAALVVGLRGAVPNAGVLLELSLDLNDHEGGGVADSLHSHRREVVGEHRADDQTGKLKRAQDVDSLHVGAGDEGAEKSESDEAGRANSEAFANGGGRVTSGVKGIGALASDLASVGHLDDTASVVSDGAVAVNSEGGGERREHAEGSKRDAIHIRQAERDKNRHRDAKHGDGGRSVAEGQAKDDVGSSTLRA